MQGDGGTFRLRIATQKLELLTGTLIAGINSSYVAVVAGILYCAMLRSSCWPAIRFGDDDERTENERTASQINVRRSERSTQFHKRCRFNHFQ